MGQVFRARDTRLDRDVAIKVLPEAFAHDTDRLARFQREAKTLASLNHPHIAGIYGLEESGGVTALVMELVEGEDLSQRIARGAIPMDEALPIARQIAEALEAAHEQGIIHRDLKPANIKVRPDGMVKVLDFGLAKAMDPTGGSSANAMNSPTLSMHATQAGIILGTAAYMSPEQAAGKAVDKRSDLWAFGVVLLEMLTGRPVFAGETLSHVLAAVLRAEPDWSALPPDTPAPIRRLLRRCLDKDRKRRLDSAADARLEIDDALTATSPADRTPRRSARRPWMWVVAIAGVSAAALFVGTRLPRQRAESPASLRFQIPTPPTSEPLSFALSPDARHLAFVGATGSASKLFLRPLDQLTSRELAGTEGAIFPFWSPDSRRIVFFANGKMKMIDSDGGAVRIVTDAPNGRGGTWNLDGTIVFAPSTAGILMRISSSGGAATPVTRLSPGQNSHRWPEFLPDGRHFLFVSTQGAKGTQGLFVGSLDGGDPIRLLEDEVPATYVAPGMLLLVRKGGIDALRFDPVRATVTGDGVQVAEAVGWDGSMARGAVSASSRGVLAYRSGLAVPRRLTWYDRGGVERGTVGPIDENAPAGPEISPDGHRAAISRMVGSSLDIWLMDLVRGVPSRFTLNEQIDLYAVWASSQRVIFTSTKNGLFEFYEKSVSGDGAERLLAEPTGSVKLPMSVSSDGRFLLYAIQVPATGVDLWALPLDGIQKPLPIAQTRFDEEAGQFSPDGHWVAYQSNESGRMEIYLKPFPGPGTQFPVSPEGGAQPRWRADGKELFYVSRDSRLMAVPVASGAGGGSLEVGRPTPLFSVHLATGLNILPAVGTKQQYAVAADGRFLMNVPVEGGSIPPITIVTGWNGGTRP